MISALGRGPASGTGRVLAKIERFMSWCEADVNLRSVVLAPSNGLLSLHKSLTLKFQFRHYAEVVMGVFDFNGVWQDGGRYSPLELVRGLGVRVCPYCNRQYVTIVDGEAEQGTTRPPLDHFYPRSRYPELSLSFYNLVPTCSLCNLRKSNHDPGLGRQQLVHPYREGFGGEARFRLLPSRRRSDVLPWLVRLDRAAPRPGTLAGRVSRSIQKLGLEDAYQSHVDIGLEIVDKALEHSPEHFAAVAHVIRDLHPEPEEFYRFYFGNYYCPEDHGDRPLAKFTRDIVDDLGIIPRAFSL